MIAYNKIKKSRIYFLGFILIGFAACTNFKGSKPSETMAKTGGIPDEIEDVSHSQAFEKGNWPKENWWEIFQDENLNILAKKAIDNNFSLLVAKKRIEVSYQRANQVKSSLFPHLGSFFSDNYEHLSKDSIDRFFPSKVPAVINQVDLGLDFSYEFDFWGKNRKAYLSSIEKMRAKLAEKELIKLMVVTNLVKVYVELQTAYCQKELLEELLHENQSLLDYNALRLTRALDNEIDVESSKQQVAKIEKRLRDNEKEIALYKHQIHLLIGSSQDENIPLKKSEMFFASRFALPNDISSNLIARRADVAMQKSIVASFCYDIGVAKAAFYPSLNLKASAGVESLHWSDLFTSSNFSGNLNPSIYLPIFEGGRLRANVREKVNEVDSAILEYNNLILKATTEVMDEISTFSSFVKQCSYQDEIIESSRVKRALSDLRFQIGISNIKELIESKKELIESTFTQTQLQKNKSLSFVLLIKALGGGFEMEEEDDN